MKLQVEFFGIPRLRAGTALMTLAFAKDEVAVSEVFRELSDRCPEFASHCLTTTEDVTELQAGYLLSINGHTFTRSSETTLHDGDSLLILSADLGG